MMKSFLEAFWLKIEVEELEIIYSLHLIDTHKCLLIEHG